MTEHLLEPVFARFQEEAKGVEVPLTDCQIRQFRIYFLELCEWNRVVRLVSKADLETIVWVHFFDSITPYPYLTEAGSLLDIGAGAGFPGIPLKIALPELRLHLLEPRRRKAHFLKHIVRELGLKHTEVDQSRFEQFEALGCFHTITCRAFASPNEWLPHASELLDEGGQFLLMLGRRADEQSLRNLMKELKLNLHACKDFELPVVGHRRRIMVLRKDGCFT